MTEKPIKSRNNRGSDGAAHAREDPGRIRPDMIEDDLNQVKRQGKIAAKPHKFRMGAAF